MPIEYSSNSVAYDSEITKYDDLGFELSIQIHNRTFYMRYFKKYIHAKAWERYIQKIVSSGEGIDIELLQDQVRRFISVQRLRRDSE